MDRYISRRAPARSDWIDDHRGVDALSREVHDPGEVETGLIDVGGNKIVRVMDTIGFVRFDED